MEEKVEEKIINDAEIKFYAKVIGKALQLYQFEKDNIESAFEKLCANLLIASKNYLSNGDTELVFFIDSDYLDFNQVSDGKYNNDQLIALSKAGTIYRYCLKNYENFGKFTQYTDELFDVVYEMYMKKYEEDHPSEESLEEIDELLEGTDEDTTEEEIIEEADETIEEE